MISGSSTTMDRSRSPTSPPWSTSTVNSESTDPAPSRPAGRRLQPNLTRRTHTKSRKGCYTCKGRKIKCDEQKPACKNCQLKITTCIYPPSQSQQSSGVVRRNSTIPSSLSSSLCSFTLQDMQFFHHFLTHAYPHLPLGNDEVWVKDIPRFAQEHSYLMHAMLALGASHLGRISPNNVYGHQALQHRGVAITGLNNALAKSELAYGEADALLATCYALTFQSTYMSDGMADFITFIRGCALATGRIRHVGANTAFDIRPDRFFDIVKPRLRQLPPMNALHIFGGLEGLDRIRPFVSAKADIDFFNALYGVYKALQSSSPEGYIEFVKIFSIWCSLSAEDFQILLDPTNIISQILSAYFIATELIMTPLVVLEIPDRAGPMQRRTLMGIASWAHEIYKRVPAGFQHHLEWPKSIVTAAVAEVSGLPNDGPAVLTTDVKLTRSGSEYGHTNGRNVYHWMENSNSTSTTAPITPPAMITV